MKITRIVNGTEYVFELSPWELSDAYYEQQYEFDQEDIRTLLDSFDDDYWQEKYGTTRDEMEPLVEDMAIEMRRMIEKYDVDWDYAREEAVRNILRLDAEEN